ncbi:uncharacterized protein LOC143149900 isoform X2 [Ptiloglossa arizonensis]|uniref:uncharacterized protein LOC143149900 isoform X2 n=1 Tax=Ptiloglossa arizonensis TaxID=3350558 RepID=UPI003F9EE30F
MWFVLLAVYAFKILCIFGFIVYCVVAFLMIMIRESVDDKLDVLTEKLTEKEHALQRSHCEIKNAEKILSDLEKKTSTCRDRYRLLMTELKKDVRKTEEEVKTLQNQISCLSVRRETLRNEALKQQEDYQKMLNNFTKELESKKVLFLSSGEKSRRPHVSCLTL